MQQSSGFFEMFRDISHKNVWIFEIFIGLLVLVIIDFIFKHVIKVIKKKHVAGEYWKVKLDYILLNPVKLILVIIGIFYVLDILAHKFNFDEASNYLVPLRNAALVIAIAWIVLRWKKEIQSRVLAKMQKKKRFLDQPSVDFIGKIFSIAFIFLIILVVLEIFGIDIMPLVAFGGIGAAALGFAAKDVIANFFGGMMLHVARPVVKGELIDIPDQNVLAVVEHIGWYMTSLRDLTKTPVYLPNNIFATAMIKNLSRMTHRRIEENVLIRFSDIEKIPKLVQEISSFLHSRKDVDQAMPINVNFQNFSSYSVEIYVRCYILETRYEHFLNIRQEILLHIKKIMTSFDIEIPYPIMTIQDERKS